jgi:outer membrane protein OmpA-like peptidoglycan-associated protein
VGDTARISCDANSPDNRPLTIFFQGPAAALNQQNSAATLNTAGLQPGRVTITATVSDDRNLTASASSVINVEGLPPAPQASKIADIAFKPNSAVVDNRAKAILDDIALRLQRDSSATALLVGSIAPNERTALAANRAENAKTYLTTSKGIDPARVQTRAGAQQEGTKTDIWIVPAGAAIPPNAF